jgi:sterol desaturase/sphingolipid hydroxylase (fatty acid hydroxylase superfamily)
MIDNLHLDLSYNWQATLAFFVLMVLLVRLGYFLAFKVPALQRMKQYNREQDKLKKAQAKYPPVIRATNKSGMYTNIAFFILILPWFITLDLPPLWRILLNCFTILMVYDFFYYLSHRFWFHGNGFMRKVHALHHQARTPTYIDAHYVHPLETFIGVFLFVMTIPLLAILMGPFDFLSVTLTFMIFTQLNIINHTHVDLDYFPFRTLSWITRKHHVHHVDMHKGNYATITLLYDRLFGTFE